MNMLLTRIYNKLAGFLFFQVEQFRRTLIRIVPNAGTSRAVPCQDLVDPCRAKYFRAVP